ncbi:MAG TPA: MFS transporter [Chloroflexi bacterium]|jgi:MFS family permease|nr:MFS transporter [Chloroflexota bacterium]
MGNASAAGSAASTSSASEVQASGRRSAIVQYSAAVFLFWVGLYLYVPTLPTYVATKTNDLATVGVILSMYGLWQAIIRLPLGIVSDWLGRRKPFIIAGFFLVGLGAYVMGASESTTGMLIGRAISGLAAGTWVPLVVVFSGLFPPRDAVRASALLNLVGSVARMLSTGITGSLNNIGGYSLAFYLATGAAGLAILIILPGRETVRPPRHVSMQSIVKLVSRRDVLLPTLLSTVGQYVNWATTFGFIPILARELGATDVMQSLLVSMNVAVLTLGNFLATTVVRRTGARTLIYISFIAMFLGALGASLAPTLAMVFLVQFFIGFAQGMSYPVLMGLSIRDVSDEERATAMGFHQAVYAIGMFGGPALSGLIADALGMRPMFAITGVACLFLGLLGARFLAGKQQDSH